MTQRGKILRGGVALTVRQLVSLPLNLAGMGLASVFLTPTDFGALSVITVLSSLALAGIDMGTTNALVQAPAEPSDLLLRQVQLLKGAMAIVLVVGFALCSPWISSYYALPGWMGLIWVSCAVLSWLQSQRAYQSIPLQRSLEWQTLAWADMAEIITANVVLAVAAYLFRSPVAFIFSLIARMACGLIVLLYFVPRPTDLRPTPAGGTLRELLHFGLPYQATTALSMVQKAINPILVGGLAGVNAVGLVNWSTYIVSLPLVPLQPFFAFLFATVAERKRQGGDDREKLQAVIRVCVILAGASTVLLIILLPAFVRHLFGSQWEAAVPVASVLLFGNVATLASSFLTTYLSAEGHSKAWLLIVLAETVIICALAGSGTTWFGLIGYAYGMVAAGLVVFGLQCVVIRKLTGLRVSFLHGMRLLAYTMLAVLAGRSVLALLPAEEWLQLALQATVALVIFSLGLVVSDLGQVRVDLRAFLQLLRRRDIAPVTPMVTGTPL